MTTQTCCACRWVGTISTPNGTCPHCGEKCFEDSVRFVHTFKGEARRATMPEDAGFGEHEISVPGSTSLKGATLEDVAALASGATLTPDPATIEPAPLKLTDEERTELPALDHEKKA
jgi:hypothetical protein